MASIRRILASLILILVVSGITGYYIYSRYMYYRETIYGSPSSLELTLVAINISYDEAAKYGEELFNISGEKILNVLNILESEGYIVKTFLAMNRYIVEKQIIESTESTVVIEFKPSTLIILAYNKPPKYIVSKNLYGFQIVNKTYKLLFKNIDITSKTYLLPGTINELDPEENIVLISITNQSMTETVLKIGTIPSTNKTELTRYFKETIKQEEEYNKKCLDNPRCIGGCSTSHIEYINNWPILVSDKTTCCKIIDGVQHCIIYPTMLKTAYKDMVVNIYGSQPSSFLEKILEEILASWV